MFDTNNKKKFRLILSKCLSAKENMRIDEELFNTFSTNSLPILRIYSWEKSFTIGISQKFENISSIQNYKDNWAKRITGGGVLFHGNDLSYSLLLPLSYTIGLSVKETYEKICFFLLEFYKSLGLDAKYAKDNKEIVLSKNEYCQIGFEPYDILINGKKIGGNAQRRSKNVIFQHGSIAVSKEEKNMKYGFSLEDFEIKLSIEDAQSKLLEVFKKTFNVEFEV